MFHGVIHKITLAQFFETRCTYSAMSHYRPTDFEKDMTLSSRIIQVSSEMSRLWTSFISSRSYIRHISASRRFACSFSNCS